MKRNKKPTDKTPPGHVSLPLNTNTNILCESTGTPNRDDDGHVMVERIRDEEVGNVVSGACGFENSSNSGTFASHLTFTALRTRP